MLALLKTAGYPKPAKASKPAQIKPATQRAPESVE
jgi:hypothetical protein